MADTIRLTPSASRSLAVAGATQPREAATSARAAVLAAAGRRSLAALLLVLPLPRRAHAGPQRRGRHARLLRQGAGRQASTCRSSGTPSRSRCWSRLIACCWAIRWRFLLATTTPRLGDARLHPRPAAALDQRAGAHLRLDGAARPQRRDQRALIAGRHHRATAAAAAHSPAC